MESIARGKYISGSPRKMRLVADVIRNKPVPWVIGALGKGFTNKASKEIERVVRAAVANLQSKSEAENIDIEDLFVKTIYVDAGPTLKRSRPRAQGRLFRRLKRTSHISVIISN